MFYNYLQFNLILKSSIYLFYNVFFFFFLLVCFANDLYDFVQFLFRVQRVDKDQLRKIKIKY